MITNVNDLELPMVDTKIIPSEKTIYEQLERAREVSKDTWIAKTFHGYSILGHEDIKAMLKDKRWFNAYELIIKGNPHTSEQVKNRKLAGIATLQGEAHARIKKFVLPAFSPSNVDKLRPHMRECINELIDNIIDKDHFDLQKDVFDKYPAYAICKILGCPYEDWELFNKLAENTLKNIKLNYDETFDIIMETQNEFDKYGKWIVEEKKRNPSNDLLSSLIQAEDNGQKLKSSEIQMLFESIITGGIDTTKGQLGLTTLTLLKDKNLWKRIASEENIRNGAIEESLRIDGSLKNVTRYATEDIIYRNILFPKGTIIILSLFSANFDEKTFESPDTFNTERENLFKENLAFGAGLHRCIGVALAKAEVQEALSIISARIPDLEISGDIVYKDTTDTAWGCRSIPVKTNL
jgi:cytochrome P450